MTHPEMAAARPFSRHGAAARGRALDLINFLQAAVQSGFGPFISVYLTAAHWTQKDIGFALSVGTIALMASQVPAGALIDAMRSRRFALALATVGLLLGAAMMAVAPTLPMVLASQILHSFATSMSVPAIAALSLAVVGRREIGERMGRNARWGSIGNALAAAAMGWIGYTLSYRAVFVLAAVLAVPAIAALRLLPPATPRHEHHAHRAQRLPLSTLFRHRGLIVYAGCALFFQLANAAMLPLVAAEMTERSGTRATLIIAVAIVVPQIVVAVFSPLIGRLAGVTGRRILLVVGFLALPARALAFAVTATPALVLVLQVLDGVAGAVFGVLTPLIAADISGDSGRFNLAMGIIGLAGGIGAAISTTLAGVMSDQWGTAYAFFGLAGAGAAATLTAALAMPETSPKPNQ
ncbi:MAG: MFS transporter [Acidibrevibacterium sp.]|uniref:MFS transporter n=1 Tax=Acidibrevibacterium sp. TaxID=2606776 RepID=UPI003CFE51F0